MRGSSLVNQNRFIYLDNNATTPIDPQVAEVMQGIFHDFVGNPSSVHRFGQRAKGIMMESQRQCAHYFDVSPDEIIFTSGATEGLNLLIRSLPQRSHIITSALEHAAVLEPLRMSGCHVTYLETARGAVTAEQVAYALRKETSAIVITAANNETGIVTAELGEITALANTKGIPLIVDGVAYLGKGLPSLPKGIAAACFSGHKIHGPPGIGLTLVRRAFKVEPFIYGGAQQRGLRAGTENLPAIVGFATALQLLAEKGEEWAQQMEKERNRLERGVLSSLSDLHIYGSSEKRICNTTNIAFSGVDGETLLIALDLAGLAASHGSACSSGSLEPSRILLNMGIPPKMARSSLRFSLSRLTTPDEIDTAISLITQAVTRLRSV